MSITPANLAARYADDGFVFPLDVITGSQAEALLQDFESAEKELADDPEKTRILHTYPDRVLPAFDSLIRHPVLLDAVSRILGPDLLVWSASMFDKSAQSSKIVTWHQDLTYWGLDDAEEVTAWVAFSPANLASGCMQFVPGSHKQKQVAHVDTFAENNLLSRGQEIAVEVEDGAGVAVVLQPGQASLHHGHLFHSSGPNTTNQRRLGSAIRYIKTSMKQQSGQRSLVAHVSGEDRFDHFTVASSPKGRLQDEDFELCRRDIEIKRTVLYADVDPEHQGRAGKRY